MLVEVHYDDCEVIGEAKPGGPVNDATGVIALVPGQRVHIAMKMQLNFEGKFTVKAINPNTFATYNSLKLKTDYL